MQKKLTLTVSPDVYSGLHLKIGRGKISSFFEKLVRPYVTDPTPDKILKDCQNMLQDKKREAESKEWLEAPLTDSKNETW